MTTALSKDTAQVIYMNHLLKIANEHALNNKENLAFDPQGRVLVDVSFSDEQIQTLVTEISSKNNTSFPLSKTGLDAALGRIVSTTTTVSLDITQNEPLLKQFNIQLESALKKTGVTDCAAIIKQLNTTSKGSIIALQQEFHFHLALVSRVYQQLPALAGKENNIKSARQAATHEVNPIIMAAFAAALKTSIKKDGSLDHAKLNKSLDKSRKLIVPQAQTIMMQHIIKHCQVILKESDLKKAVDGSSLKNSAASTTATANDILHTNHEHGLITLIAGSENTAHYRIKGEHFAHRQLITHHLNHEGIVENNEHSRIQIRTPSPVLKKGLANDDAYISDVMIKLSAVNKEYDLPNRITSTSQKPRAFVYNSYTAINDFIGDVNGNLQSQSARHILRGAHRYNVNQLRNHADNSVLCFVQNISVNGFGDSLGYDHDNTLVSESTLMTEIALLHTLYESASLTEQHTINHVFELYKTYLQRSPNREVYFFQSAEGQEVIQVIDTLKNDWAKPNDLVNAGHIIDNAKLSLRNMMAYDLHFNHKYSKLFQSLSVFVEEASIGGCKSGNERAQAINGRVALFDSLLNTKNPSPNMQYIATCLALLAKGNSIAQNALALKRALDVEYNATGLQTAASMVSLVDQGASAKVEGKPGHPFFISRNYGEEEASALKNLHQSKAGAMQSHKNLTTQMQNAWQGHPQSWWVRMRSNPLGVFGGLLGVITVIPAIAVFIYNLVENGQRRSATVSANLELQKQSVESLNKVPLDTNPIDSASYNSYKNMNAPLLGIPRDLQKQPKQSAIPVPLKNVQTTPPAAELSKQDVAVTNSEEEVFHPPQYQ